MWASRSAPAPTLTAWGKPAPMASASGGMPGMTEILARL
jgi:hypothetical protein